MSNLKRGALIVLEGCDRAGKTTQCKKLVAALNDAGLAAKEMHFPGKRLNCFSIHHCIAIKYLHIRQDDGSRTTDRPLSEDGTAVGRSCNSLTLFCKSLGTRVSH